MIVCRLLSLLPRNSHCCLYDDISSTKVLPLSFSSDMVEGSRSLSYCSRSNDLVSVYWVDTEGVSAPSPINGDSNFLKGFKSKIRKNQK